MSFLCFACDLCYFLCQKSQIIAFLFSAYFDFGGKFVTIATLKVKIPDLYLGYSFNKEIRRNLLKATCNFDLIGRPK